jgi:hypothetical protein
MSASEMPQAVNLPTLQDQLNANIPPVVSQNNIDSSKEFANFKLDLIVSGFSESDAVKLATVLSQIVVLLDKDSPAANFVVDDKGLLLAFIPRVTSGIRGGERPKPTFGRLGSNNGKIHYSVKPQFRVRIPRQAIAVIQSATLKYFNNAFNIVRTENMLRFVAPTDGDEYD